MSEHVCKCGKSHHGGTGAGFAVGVAVGAAAASLADPKTRKKATKKLDELTGGKAPQEFIDSIKEVVGQITEDIKGGEKAAPKRKPRVRKKK